MRFAVCLVITGVLAGGTASLPATGRTALMQDTCFSDTVPADRRIAACSATIRSARQGSSLKALALLNRAGAYGQKGEYGRAADDSSQAIREAPSAMAYYTRALAYHDLGEDEQAIRDCNEALAIDPKSENALFVRGAARQQLADYSGAIRDYSDVLRLDPGRPDALFARGTANYSSGEYQAAVSDFSKATPMRPYSICENSPHPSSDVDRMPAPNDLQLNGPPEQGRSPVSPKKRLEAVGLEHR